MKSLQESLQYKLFEGKQVPSTITWGLVDMYDVGADAYLEGEGYDPKSDKNTFKFFNDFMKLLHKLDANIHTRNLGNLYYDGSLYDFLIEMGEIEDDDHGFVLNRDGDCETSLLVVFGERVSSADQKKLDEFISAYDNHPSMMIAEQF